jgi:hypothetical protein
MPSEKPGFKLRQQLLQDQQMGELARDVQKVFDLINPCTYKKFRAFYTEPLVLGVFVEPPLCIELVRITPVVAAEQPVRCGGFCDFVYKPLKGGAIITSIDGLSPVVRTEYDFVFKITFEAG